MTVICRLLEVERSSYYDWLKTDLTTKNAENEHLFNRIKEIFMKNRNNYGTRRIKKTLKKEGIIASRRRIGRLLKEHGLYCKTRSKFKVTTDSKHQLPIAPNLLERNFTVTEPNQCYVGDMTYIYTDEGWLYLAVVMDLFSRMVVGWSMKPHMKTALVNDALLMAIWKRKPNRGLLWHTDRGSQYASESHRQLLKEHGVIQSMSRKGNCWDNAVAESFFHSLKTELVYQQKFRTREEAKKAIFEYIEIYYNQLRMHSSNDYLSPVEFENLRIAV